MVFSMNSMRAPSSPALSLDLGALIQIKWTRYYDQGQGENLILNLI